jgi:ATP-dependent exoDNAse (exonuclease V) beta subunit
MERVTYISAGAGSGKTYTLTHLLANHIANGDVEPEKVILTTYTKKAAAEFREKAKSVLYEEGRTNPMLYEAAARLEQASIGTVHAVANSFVQKYWYYLGLSPQQKVIAEEDVNFYISQSLAELPTEEEIKFLNKFRYQFSIEKLRDPGNPAMGSYADYGFWKDLLVQVIKKSETFGVNDLAESRQKSLDLVRRLYHGNMAMPTAKDITEVIPELLEAIKKATFRTEETRETVKESISKFESVPQILSFLWIKDFKEALSSVVARATVARQAPKAVALNGKINIWNSPIVRSMNEQLVNTIFDMADRWKEGYEQYKSQNHLLDYDDMERYMLELLKRADVRDDISSSYEYLFVDEFQDSSPIQVQIFDELSKLMKKSYWVGDYKQAIYGFRGTDTDLVKAVVDTISKGKNGNHLDKPLGTCWRSEPAITNMVNNVFIPVFRADGLERNMVRLEPKTKKADDPIVIDPLRLWKLDYDRKDQAIQEISRKIAVMVLQGIRPSDIAVLNNSNSDLNTLAEELRKYNLPVHRSDGSITEEKEKQLLFALLSLLVNKRNTMAMLQVHYLTTPNSSLGQLIDQKLDDPDFLSSHPLIQQLFKQRDKFNQQSVSSLVESVIIEMDLYGESRHWDTTTRGFNILRTCIEIARQYEEHCLQLGLPATISGYMSYVDNTDIKTEGDSDGVCLYTIHGSKGLEWKYVILTSLEIDFMNKFYSRNFFGVQTRHDTTPSADTLYVPMTITVLPWIFGGAHNPPSDIMDSIRGEDNENEITLTNSVKSEAKRKLYVGMTRASEHLILAHIKTRQIGDPMKWFHNIGVGTNELTGNMTQIDIFKSEDPSKPNNDFFAIEELPSPTDENALIYPSQRNTDKVLSLQVDNAADTFERRDIQPSMIDCIADEVKVLLDEPRQRIPIEKVRDEDTMAKVGTCIHNIFCTIDNNHNEDFVISAIIAHEMQEHLTNAKPILQAWDWLVEFMTRQFGPAIATYHERPFKYESNGQITTGSIDLVWKTGKGCIVIDYKTYPNWNKETVTSPEDKHYAGKYKGQLDCYEKALSLNGEKVLAKLIYYPVNGMIVQI